MDWINVTFNYTKNDEVISLSRVFDSVNVDEVEVRAIQLFNDNKAANETLKSIELWSSNNKTLKIIVFE
jgi:hypothetical protein